jgi:hypothetical protein
MINRGRYGSDTRGCEGSEEYEGHEGCKARGGRKAEEQACEAGAHVARYIPLMKRGKQASEYCRKAEEQACEGLT